MGKCGVRSPSTAIVTPVMNASLDTTKATRLTMSLGRPARGSRVWRIFDACASGRIVAATLGVRMTNGVMATERIPQFAVLGGDIAGHPDNGGLRCAVHRADQFPREDGASTGIDNDS